MTNDTETIDLLLQLFEGLDLLTEQLELFESAFGDEEMQMPVLLVEQDDATGRPLS